MEEKAHSRRLTLLGLVGLNVAVFLFLRVAAALGLGIDEHGELSGLIEPLELPNSFSAWLQRPWALLSYMFTQWDFLHLALNMLWLYWFVEADKLMGGFKLIGLYLCGGIAGGIAFMSLGGVAQATPNILGASAAVIAIVGWEAVRNPKVKMEVPVFGMVPLVWVAVVTITADLIGISWANIGGHIAHLGGLLVGMIAALVFPSPKIQSVKKVPAEVLEKARQSGYTSLTEEEKKQLWH